MVRSQKIKKDLYLAVQEHQLAASAFKEAMENADVGWVGRTDGIEFTFNMSLAWMRFKRACYRLHELRSKANESMVS